MYHIKIEEIRNLEMIEEIMQVVLKYKRNGIMPNDAKVEEKSILIYLNNRYSIYQKFNHIDDHLGI